MTTSFAIPETQALRMPMRVCAGIALFNAQGRVWVGRRQPKWLRRARGYADGPIWQLPQGGIDKGERAADAAFRELWEETGITNATLLAELPEWVSFELPSELRGVALKGKFAGQRLRWFAMRFCGDDNEINLAPKGPMKSEFDAWRWADLDELPQLALPFKRPVYERVASQFAEFGSRAAR